MLRSSHDACGCSTPDHVYRLKRSTLHPHEGQADRPNTPSDSVNPGSNPGHPAMHTGFFGSVSARAEKWRHLRGLGGRAHRDLVFGVRSITKGEGGLDDKK